MSEWVSVSDRLPEQDRPVLVHYNGLKYGDDKYKVACITNEGQWYTGFGLIAEGWITHWMEIQAPPKEN